MANMNVRSALEYVPYFRGRLFVLHLDASLLRSREIVDILLDADALHEIGVSLAIIVEGDDAQLLLKLAMHSEMHVALAEKPLHCGSASYERIAEIIRRGQIAIVASGEIGRFSPSVRALVCELKADKFINIQDGDIPTRQGRPLYAIARSKVVEANDCSNYGELLQAASLCQQGIQRVHLLDGRMRGSLLDELFSEEGVGTMVHTDSYQEIRRLQPDDIPELLSMIARSMADAKLLYRHYESIFEQMDNYYIYTLDDTIVGCVALYPYPEENSAELGCLFIKHNYEGHGYGRALCDKIEALAHERGYELLFAVSQSAVAYFRDRLHYAAIDRSCIPAKRLAKLEASERKSEIFGCRLH